MMKDKDKEHDTKLDRQKLIKMAMAELDHAYAPYSGFYVAAAVLMDNGRVYTGVNIENASYPATVCAERNGIFKAISDDKRAKIVAIAVVGGKDGRITDYCAPCGVCRQVMREFCEPSSMKIIMAKDVDDYREMTLAELLPYSFGPDALK